MEQGGYVINDKDHWNYPDGKVVDIADWDINRDIFNPYKDKLKYQIYEFKDWVEVDEHEVDDNFIISHSLIKRCISTTDHKEGGVA